MALQNMPFGTDIEYLSWLFSRNETQEKLLAFPLPSQKNLDGRPAPGYELVCDCVPCESWPNRHSFALPSPRQLPSNPFRFQTTPSTFSLAPEWYLSINHPKCPWDPYSYGTPVCTCLIRVGIFSCQLVSCQFDYDSSLNLRKVGGKFIFTFSLPYRGTELE